MKRKGTVKHEEGLKRLQRLVKILQIIENRRPGRKDLAEELKITERQLYRDINDLIAAELPIMYDRSKGVYCFEDTFSLKKISVKADELQSLLMARELFSKTGGGFKEGIEGVYRKILAAQSEPPVRMQLEPAIDFSKIEPQYHAIHKAIDDNLRVEVEHLGQDDKYTKREIDPYRLFYSNGFWYVLGWCHKRQDIRTFALDRIRKVLILEKHNLTMAGFDFDAYMANCWRSFYLEDPQEIVIRFAPDAAKDIRRKEWHPTQKIKDRKDGSLDLTVLVSDGVEIMRWVLSWGREAQVLQPKSLKNRIKEEVAEMGKLYRKPV